MTFTPDHHSDGPAPAPPMAPGSAYSQTPEQKARKLKTRHANFGPGGSMEVPEDTPEPPAPKPGDPIYAAATLAGTTGPRKRRLGEPG